MRRREFYAHTDTKKFPKAVLKKEWKKTKTPKWRLQTRNNWNDGFTDYMSGPWACQSHKYPRSKGTRKAIKQIKHKLYFNIPFNEIDQEFIKNNPWYFNEAKRNVEKLIKSHNEQKS